MAPVNEMVDLGCTLALVNLFLLEIHFMVNWKLSKEGVRRPVSHDYIAG